MNTTKRLPRSRLQHAILEKHNKRVRAFPLPSSRAYDYRFFFSNRSVNTVEFISGFSDSVRYCCVQSCGTRTAPGVDGVVIGAKPSTGDDALGWGVEKENSEMTGNWRRNFQRLVSGVSLKSCRTNLPRRPSLLYGNCK